MLAYKPRFMEYGLDHDDRFRMVEDELEATAKLFTRHLHAAEYRRMREESRRRNKDMITTISRPVTQKMSETVKRKAEVMSRAEVQADLADLLKTAKVDDDSSEDESAAWLGTALHGLMESPSKSAPNLNSLSNISSKVKKTTASRKIESLTSQGRQSVSSDTSRSESDIVKRVDAASKGSVSAIQDSGAEVDDDLDGPDISEARSITFNAVSRHNANASHQTKSREPAVTPSGSFGQSSLDVLQSTKLKPEPIEEETTFDGISSKKTSEAAARIARRLKFLQRPKEEESLPHLNDIPTFT